MKKLILAAMLLSISTVCFADHVNGYFRKNGTYVQGYERSSPNETVTDNYSYKGNENPYTGQTGDNYYRHSPSSQYYESSGIGEINSHHKAIGSID